MAKSVFVGTTAECLRHFAKRFWAGSAQEVWPRRKTIAELFDVSPETVSDWFGKNHLPIGENKVRLQNFLKLAGYEVVEQAQLKPPLDDLAIIIATRTATADEVASALAIQRDQVYEYLLRGGAPVAEREQALRQFISDRRQVWTEKLMALKLKMRDAGLVLEPLGQKTETKTQPEASSVSPEVMLLAQLVNAAAPLAERIASNEFSASDRKLLRQLTKTGMSNNVFALSNSLNHCCGERARAQLNSKEQV